MPESAPTTEQAAAAVATETQNIIEFVQYFDRMDASSPMMRFIIAGVIVCVSLILFLVARVIVRKRMKHLEESPSESFRPLRLQAQDLLSSEDMKKIRLGAWLWLGRILSVVFILTAINGLLLTSRWTLNLAAHLIALLVAPLKFAWFAAIGYLPNLLTIVVIVFLARFMIHIIGMIFEGIKTKRIRIPNFYPEWADPSFGIVKLMVIVLTSVIIFPYLPGSSSPAFKGISIFLGLLVSLGSTTAVANVIAGTVLTYTRAFKVGDQVNIADKRGRIVERSTFVTRIQTLKNVIVSIPNSMVLNNNIINYSQNMGKRGILVHTSITIGYDVPWQTVNRLLTNAAAKTEFINPDPEPFVLQTSLDDNYVSYEINGWTQEPEKLSKIYSDLHANILDAFHSEKIEITSPAYRANRDGNELTIPDVITQGDASA